MADFENKTNWTVVKPGQKLVKDGFFDFKEIYKKLVRWFNYKGYTLYEKNYEQYVQEDGSKKVILEWEAKKQLMGSPTIDGKAVIEIKINFNSLIFMSKAETEIEGKKVKMDKGKWEIRAGAVIIVNDELLMNKNILMQQIYHRFIIKKPIDNGRMGLAKEYDSLMKLLDDLWRRPYGVYFFE